ncbi:hypothetical protein [Nonomuraea cavernae]|uniref:hypothetical protein n=1 Tax=Nonomuraea cavernae TaxID=2045107 RepID=UPI0033F00FB1
MKKLLLALSLLLGLSAVAVPAEAHTGFKRVAYFIGFPLLETPGFSPGEESEPAAERRVDRRFAVATAVLETAAPARGLGMVPARW